MLILRRYVDKNPRAKNSRRFDILFRRNFDGRKLHIVLMYFVRRNIDGRKIDVISMGENLTVFRSSKVLCQRNFDWLTNDTTLACLCWFVYERQELVVIFISIFHKFSIYLNWKSSGCHLLTQLSFDVLFQRNFVPIWNMLGS